MDLSDIFGGDISPKETVETEPLGEQAAAAAAAYDETRAHKAQYEHQRNELLEEIDRKLDGLKTAWQDARERSNGLLADLKTAMEDSDTLSISMSDRKSVHIKTIAGRKKTISLKWMKETLGIQHANDIWRKVGKTPDKKELIIPPRFEDEPSV